ncbi:MAG: DUF4843 domain-containing protein, partial [Bacteroidia bacterium]
MWLKFLYRLLFITAVLFSLNTVYKTYILPIDLETHSDVYPKIKALQSNIDVLYIGESSNITHSFLDTDKRPISAFISDYYPYLSITDITQAGAHAGIYYEILAAIPDSVSIKTLVVTMNYRSFSADWIYSNLERALRKKTVLLRKSPAIYNRFLLAFKGFGGYDEIDRIPLIHASWLTPYKDTSLPYKNITTWDNAIAKRG